MLCLHGFTGTPYELRPIAEALAHRGYDVAVPTLAGHGADVAALEATTWPDWLRSAEEAFDALAARTAGAIAVVGFSMGGLLALRLGKSRRSRIAALAVLAAPLRLRAVQIGGIRLLARLPAAMRRGPLRAVPKLFGSGVADPEARRANPGLRAMPVAGLRSLLDLMAEVRGDLGDIEAPALVVHGRKDRTVPLAASVELAQRLEGDRRAASATGGGGGSGAETAAGAALVERLWLDRSKHLVGVDVDRDLLSETVVRFLATRARW